MRTSIARSSITPLRRVLRSCQERCVATRERPSLRLVTGQISFRSGFLGKSAATAEMSSFRSFLGALSVEGPHRERDDILNEFPWAEPASVKELADVIGIASTTPSEYPSLSRAEISRIRSSETSFFHMSMSDEDIMKELSGVKREASERVRNRKNASLSYLDYQRLMMDISNLAVDESFRRMKETGRVNDGVCAALLASLYLTGMRPIEAWSFEVLVPSTDLALSPAGVDMIRTSPSSAVRSGILRRVSEEADESGFSRGEALLRSMSDSGAPAIISIKSAKQENANPYLACPYRFMIVEEISQRDANLISWASELSLCDASELGRRRVISATERRLKAVLMKIPEMRQDVTLYTFRHSFATRLRFAMDDASSAALSGHTSVRTFEGYGEKKGSGSGSGWIPKPDPERAALISSVWRGEQPEHKQVSKALDDRPSVVRGEAEVSADIAVRKSSEIKIVMRQKPDREPSAGFEPPSPSPWG